MKIIRVERCSMCPCLNWSDDPFDIMCRGLYHAEYRRIKDVDIIPKWCPLEEADRTSSGQVTGQEEGEDA